jgi:hypothetical protein
MNAALLMAGHEPQGFGHQVRHLKEEHLLAKAQRLFFERRVKGAASTPSPEPGFGTSPR